MVVEHVWVRSVAQVVTQTRNRDIEYVLLCDLEVGLFTLELVHELFCDVACAYKKLSLKSKMQKRG